MATAIITDLLKNQFVDTLATEFADSASNLYYIAIGYSEQFDSADDTPALQNSEREMRQFRYRMQSMKSVLDASLVIPRYNWSSGTIYAAYNDNSVSQTSRYYVINENNNVYVCIKQGKDTNGNAVTSTDQPTGDSATALFTGSDGYKWKYLYTISAAKSTRFLTANFMPVQFINDSAGASSLSTTQAAQASVQDNAVDGQIVGYRVTATGSGYTSVPSITITGNGKGAQAKAIVTSSNTIGAIEIDDSAGGIGFGSGYDYANITISGGGGANAAAVPIFAPVGGIGADATRTLRARAINFNVLFDGAENDFFVIDNDFRQLALIKNPLQYDSTGSFTAAAGRALKKMFVDDSTADFQTDQTLTGTTSTAQALIDIFDNTTGHAPFIYYHQTETTGFTPFQDAEEISTSSATANIADSATIAPDVDPFSGDILYLDNRNTAVFRSNDQTEDVKIIIQL